MFKKFKDKLAEEMKQSPARLQASMQHLAQAVVSPALSNSSIQELSTSNDNFSLTDDGDETPKNSPARHGFQNVDLISPASNSMGMSRRSSVSSITSDTSSLFPIYESPTNLYHLQSDMDQSASEIDENINPQLDKVTKDQLYSAYRKVQVKYHKYRGRYTDLAAHYRELERVKGKLESVLVETQDKVLRRIADLKEQCQLEQQAKAHLEEALRNDIEEKDHIINTLNTKIKLLQANGSSVDGPPIELKDDNQNPKENLIDLTSEPATTPPESSLGTENVQLKDKVKKLENLILKYKDSLKRNKDKFTEVVANKATLESEYETFKNTSNERMKALGDDLTKARSEIESLADQVSILKKREEESVISLAENKLSIHRELEDKEEQIKQLRLELKHLTETHENLIEKHKNDLEKLKQNLEAEKEEIIQDLSRGKSEALKLMQQKLQQKVIDLEEKMGSKYHEEVNRNKELTKKLEKLEEEVSEKAAKSDETEAIKNLSSQLEEKESALQTLKSDLDKLRQLSEEYRRDRDKVNTEFSNCMLKYKETVSEVEAQKLIIEENRKEATSTIEKFQATIQSLDKELENIRGALMDRDKVCEHYNVKIHEYTSMLEKAKEKLFSQETEIKSLKHLEKDCSELSVLRDELEVKNTELLGLHSEVHSCKSTISDLKEALQVDRSQIELLSKEKNSLSNYILQYKDFLRTLKEDCANIKGNFTKEFAEQNDRISLLNNTLATCLIKFEKQGAEESHEVKDTKDSSDKYIDLEKELADTIRQKSALEFDINERDKKLQELLARVDQTNQLESKNCKLIAEIDNLNFKLYDLQELCKESAELKKEVERLNKEIIEITTINTELVNEKSLLNEKLKVAQTTVEELQEFKQNFEQATETIKVLNSKAATHDTQMESMERLLSEVNELKTERDEKDNEIKVLNEKLAYEQTHVEKLEADYQTQSDQLAKSIKKLSNIEKSKRKAFKDYEARIAELSESTATLQESVNTKIARLKELEFTKEEQTYRIEELHDALDCQLVHFRTKENEARTLQDDVTAMSQELEQLKAFKEQVTLENKDLKDKQNELIKQNEHLQESGNTLQSKAEEYEKVNQELLKEIQELQTLLESKKTELIGQREYIEKMESQLANITTELNSRDQELMSQSEKLLLAEKGSHELQENLKKENDELRLKISELNKALENYQKMEEEYREKLVAAEQQCSKLTLEVSSLNESIIGLEQVQLKYNELITEQESLRSKIVELESISSDKTKLMSYVNTLESQVSLLEETKSQNASLKSELDALKSSEDFNNRELMSQISSLNVNNNSLTSQLGKLKHTLDERDLELKVLEKRNTELLANIERIKESHKVSEERTQEIGTLKESVKLLQEDLSTKRSELESLKDSNNALRNELQNATSSESLVAKSDKLEEDNKKLEAQLDEALITFQAKESQMQIVNNELKNQADKLREDLKTNEEEQTMRLKQLVKEFQAQLHDKEEELQAALEKRFDRQQNYESNLIQQYKEQLKDFQVELTAKSEQIERLILENKELLGEKSKNVDELTERITRMEKEHASEVKQIEENWKVVMQRRAEKLRAKHEDEVNEILKGWREDRKNDTSNTKPQEELESTSRVAMAAVQSNTGSFHTLQQTLTTQRRELAELRKLVKLRHETLEDSTEIEYLRNILFEYMMGRETMVLARVIAAVVKFDEEQTTKILKKEEDKMTLLGSLRLT